MAIDIKKLDRLDWGVLGGGLLVFISLFLPWWSASAGPFSVSVSGWSTSWGWLGGLLLVAAAVWFLLWRAAVGVPKEPLTPLAATVGAGTLGFIIVILRWITLPRGSFGLASVHYGAAAGIYMAAIVGAIEVACAILLFRKAGEPLPWAGARTGSKPAPPSSTP